ncbi:MAG TPA: heavy metal sensor histidine kinase [Candidatus Baltobacteraceae bacterium]|jgi:two-component system heavy metal sensor histidine kinase CusS|nr:heavy metal sensor histidine kinase [Candidatus Baltobacteraceae bacterium]
MSSRRTEPLSIAAKLVLLFTLTATLLLSCGLGLFYWIVVRHAFAEDNTFLADKISSLSADFKGGGPGTFGEEVRTRQAGEHVTYWIRLLDSGGRTATETPGMGRLIPPDVFPPAQESTSSIRNPKDYRTGAKLFSLVAVNEKTGGQTYTIQVAQDQSSDEQLERRFGILLGVMLAGGILASAIIAITVTKHGLRPLAEMTRSLERIGPTHLNERVAPAGWPRELKPLAFAFDEMLSRLEDSFNRLSQFSADLAHELRTPVANIMGEGQVALTRERTPDEYREAIESTIAECERLSGIVDNLLFVARVDAARESIERKLFDARAAVEKIATFYRTLAEDRNVAIHCNGDGEIYADPVLFQRAVSNLVENALRFTPRGGTIQISIAVKPTHSEVTVSDNGCGITPEHLPRVFDRFYRADSSRGSDGAGLGLALVKSIVELHGGSARIKSDVGRGTTVTLSFPNKSV